MTPGLYADVFGKYLIFLIKGEIGLTLTFNSENNIEYAKYLIDDLIRYNSEKI
jgi:hypothetical protein